MARLALLVLCGAVIVSATYKGIDPEEELAYDFLLRDMPARDRNALLPEFLNATVFYALKARHDNKWAAMLPWSDFTRLVLPYASFNEPRDNWRALFYETLAPLVAGTDSITSAFKVINGRIWDMWNVQFLSNQTPLIMSPFETMANHHASCTGMSILLVSALRSVGIPCRVAGTAQWNTPDGGNHNWVEVLVDGYWSFTEFQNLAFNSTWFWPNPAKNAIPGYEHGIFAASYEYQPNNVHFPMSWAPLDFSFPGIDVSTYYMQRK